MLPDTFLNLVLGVARARVQVLLGIDDVRQGSRELHDLGYAHDAADVDAAVADEDADARGVAAHVEFSRRLDDTDQRTALAGEDFLGRGRGARRARHGLGDSHRLCKATRHAHPGVRGRGRVPGIGQGESETVKVEVEPFR